MDYDSTYAELNIRLGDTLDTTFTPEEKASALHKAWNDSFVVKTVWDATTLWAATTFTYSVPVTMQTVKDIYTEQFTDQGPEPIASDLWEVIDGNIKFRTATRKIFCAGDTVYIKGNYKYSYATDSLPTTNLQEYVLVSAGVNTLGLLQYKQANLFLKNDISVAELINLKRGMEVERDSLRGKLLHEVQGA